MAYLHEVALKNAIKKLYMLGSSDRRRDRTDVDGVGAFGSAIVNAHKAGSAQKNLKAKMEAQKRAEFDAHGGAERFDDYDRQLVSEGNALPQKYDVAMAAKDAQKAQQLNDLAEETRMGGRYTPNGLEMADVNAQKNAEDRLRARSMMGIGGSLRIR